MHRESTWSSEQEMSQWGPESRMSCMRTSGWRRPLSSPSGLARRSSLTPPSSAPPTPAASAGPSWRTTWSAPWARTSSTRTSPWGTSPLWTPSSVTARGWSSVIQWRQWRYEYEYVDHWLNFSLIFLQCVRKMIFPPLLKSEQWDWCNIFRTLCLMESEFWTPQVLSSKVTSRVREWRQEWLGETPTLYPRALRWDKYIVFSICDIWKILGWDLDEHGWKIDKTEMSLRIIKTEKWK